jgi:hypothetical protein
MTDVYLSNVPACTAMANRNAQNRAAFVTKELSEVVSTVNFNTAI